jgi:hypothetical protein
MSYSNTPRTQAQSPTSQPPHPTNRPPHNKPKPTSESPAIPFTARWQVLMARRLPWQLDPEEAATILGFKNRENILQLVKLGKLTALGDPGEGCDRYFSLSEIDALGANPQWLHEARAALRDARKAKKVTKKATPRKGKTKQ